MTGREPLPPEILAGARQDTVHRDVGRGRAARTNDGPRAPAATTAFYGPGVCRLVDGRRVDLRCPSPDAVPMLDDLAGVLSRVCRFNGQLPVFYSVAQHAVLVARICCRLLEEEVASLDALTPSEARAVARAALHHDDGEAFVGDMISPLKVLYRAVAPGLVNLDHRWTRAACERYGVDPDLLDHPAVKRADVLAYVLEERVLRGHDVAANVAEACGVEVPSWARGRQVEPVTPVEAARLFVSTDRELRDRRTTCRSSRT